MRREEQEFKISLGKRTGFQFRAGMVVILILCVSSLLDANVIQEKRSI